MASIEEIWRKLRWSFANRGIAGTVRAIAPAGRRLLHRSDEVQPGRQAHPFDLRHGVETGGVIGGGSLGVGHAHDAFIIAYAGIAPSRFQAALVLWRGTLERHIAAEYAFVDVGCGKGRAMLLASEWPFREAAGVELNPELAEMARRNVAAWIEAGKARCPVRVENGDATEFILPPGPCLLFLYNSFAAPVLRRLLEGLVARARAGGGTVDVIYQNAQAEKEFRRRPELRLLWREALPLSDEDARADPVATAEDVTCAYRLESAG